MFHGLPFVDLLRQHGTPPALSLPKISIPKISLPQPSIEGICNLLAGGVAGAFAAAITCPLEVVKTQLQSRAHAGSGLGPLAVAAKIVREQGVRGLYRGLSPTMVGIVPTRSCYFWAYSAAKSTLSATVGEGPLTHMCAAVAAGGLSNTVTCPLWMVKTRMQLNGGGLLATARGIIAAEGVRGLYRGLFASYWGLSEGAIQFLIYEKMKHDLADKNKAAGAASGALSTGQYLLAAGLSKGIASALTYPHEVVRTRMRECGSSRYRGMFQSIALIAKEEGRQGLYGGLGPHLMRVVPNTALMFMSYEILSRRLPAILADPLLPARIAGLPAAAAAAASAAVAPLRALIPRPLRPAEQS
jgi:solute carrier family 25 protein 33/36